MGSFNARGVTEDKKKDQLVRDVNQYGMYVPCKKPKSKM